jgi:REP element-mobilizing transposase RayT
MTNVESSAPHLGWHSRGYLPHWDHPGMIQSLNFRLGDALPQAVLEKWRQELEMPSLGAPASRRRVPKTNAAGADVSAPRNEAAVELRRRIEEYLDAGHGQCWLGRREIAALVEGALLHFDTQRYQLLAWCVMPNHVHALIETKEGWPLDGVLHAWKSFTSHEAGKILRGAAGGTPALPGKRPAGEFWQREYLDRYVRNAEHYAKVLAYIEENPVKAGLAKIKTDWPWSSARFRAAG